MRRIFLLCGSLFSLCQLSLLHSDLGKPEEIPPSALLLPRPDDLPSSSLLLFRVDVDSDPTGAGECRGVIGGGGGGGGGGSTDVCRDPDEDGVAVWFVNVFLSLTMRKTSVAHRGSKHGKLVPACTWRKSDPLLSWAGRFCALSRSCSREVDMMNTRQPWRELE